MRAGNFLHWFQSIIVLSGGALLLSGCFTGEGGAGKSTEQPLNQDQGCGDVCITELLGDGATCQPYSDIKSQAVAFCEAQGRVITNLVPVAECGDGSSASQVEVTCCIPAPPPPNPEPANVCVGEVLGDGTTCLAPGDVKEQAYQLCDAQGLLLVDLGLSLDCADGGSTFAKVLCCDTPPPPPPEQTSCTFTALGDGSTCATEDVWKAQAIADCDAQGLVLTDIGFAQDCADGTSGYIKYSCCEPE